MNDQVYDGNGKALTAATRVRCGADLGVVTYVSEWDGDVDDEGRSVGYPPVVGVAFDDGTVDRFSCYVELITGHTVCDDLEVVE